MKRTVGVWSAIAAVTLERAATRPPAAAVQTKRAKDDD
jgi:hypothetical protein